MWIDGRKRKEAVSREPSARLGRDDETGDKKFIRIFVPKSLDCATT